MDPRRWSHIDIETDVEKPDVRLCDVDGCRAAGDFRAPKSRSQLRDYHFFCLEHVQAYNKSWNFYEGMDEDQIEANRRADVTWQRKTWPFTAGGRDRTTGFDTPGAGRSQQPPKGPVDLDDLEDPFELFEGPGFQRAEPGTRKMSPAARRALPREVVAALDLFELVPLLAEETVRARYKELAKENHPDANDGDRDKEEMFKRVNSAYDVLKACPDIF